MYKTIIYFSFSPFLFSDISLIQLKARIKLKKSVKFCIFYRAFCIVFEDGSVSKRKLIPVWIGFRFLVEWRKSGETRESESIHVSFRFFFATLNTNYGTWRAEFVSSDCDETFDDGRIFFPVETNVLRDRKSRASIFHRRFFQLACSTIHDDASRTRSVSLSFFIFYLFVSFFFIYNLPRWKIISKL